MSLFDRLLEKELRARPAKPTFAEKREQWLQEASAKAERGEPLEHPQLKPAVKRPTLKEAVDQANRELGTRAPTLDLIARAMELVSPPPPPPVNLAGPLVAKGSCKAINPETGRQCALLAGHTTSHRHGRTEFTFGAAPDQTSFTRRDRLDQLASSRNGSPFTTPATGD